MTVGSRSEVVSAATNIVVAAATVEVADQARLVAIFYHFLPF